MKKISVFTAAILGLAFAASAQLKGLGYDANWKQISARIGLGANAVDVGVGMAFDNTKNVADNKVFGFSASGLFLGHLHDFGPVDTYFAAGGIASLGPDKTDATGKDTQFSLASFVGLQPEVTLLDHIVVSVRFGLDIPITPDFKVQTAGDGISIVNGANFKILF